MRESKKSEGGGLLKPPPPPDRIGLRTVTGCTRNTNIQHLHDEPLTLPLTEHFKPHASQIEQKAQHPCDPLQKLTKRNRTSRLMKQTSYTLHSIFEKLSINNFYSLI